MDYAVYIQDLSKFNGLYLKNYAIKVFDNNNLEIRECNKIISKLSNEKIKYLYYGTEFCEMLLPNTRQVIDLVDICHCHNINPVLVTPTVTDWGIKKIEKIIEELLARNVVDLTVVVNDFGVLELLKKKKIKCIMGRLFDKISHDSRGYSDDFYKYYGEDGMRYAKSPGNLSNCFINCINQYNINRFEFDMPKIGIDLYNSNFAYSLYWPYSFISTGRVCLFKSFNQNAENKFLVNGKCDLKCKTLQLQRRKPRNGFVIENNIIYNEEYIYQIGNTSFYIPHIDTENINQFDRLIIQYY